MKVLMTILVGLTFLCARGDDLVTRSGEVHHDYQVLSYDTGFVTIMDRDGGARIPLSELPASLQREYHYDPAAAAAAVQQFDTQDHQEKLAVEQNEISPTVPATTLAPTLSSTEQPPAGTTTLPPATASSAPLSQNAVSASTSPEAVSSTFDAGFDPLAPDASILSSQPVETYDEGDQQNFYYDPSGTLWLGSTDTIGMVRWSRAAHEQRWEQIRLNQNDLPPGAVVVRDTTGRWMVTYVDAMGHMRNIYRPELGNSIHEGTWKVVMNTNGTRSIQRQDGPREATYRGHEYFPSATYSSDGYREAFTSAHPQTTSFHGATATRVVTSASSTTTAVYLPPRR